MKRKEELSYIKKEFKRQINTMCGLYLDPNPNTSTVKRHF